MKEGTKDVVPNSVLNNENEDNEDKGVRYYRIYSEVEGDRKKGERIYYARKKGYYIVRPQKRSFLDKFFKGNDDVMFRKKMKEEDFTWVNRSDVVILLYGFAGLVGSGLFLVALSVF